MKQIRWLCGIGAVILSAGVGAEGVDDATLSLCRNIARVKSEQAVAHAAAAALPMPKLFVDYLEAGKEGAFDRMDGLYARIRRGAQQYEDSTNPAPDQATAIWQYVQECFGAVDLLREGEGADLWRGFAGHVFEGMPSNSVYFGGTDPGRYIPTAMRDAEGLRTDVTILTQNALADNTYMDYMRYRWGDRMRIPSTGDMANVFQEFVRSVQSKQVQTDADVRVEDGRVRVHGVRGVMMINAILARRIFDSNKDAHAFFVEESYIVPWMQPYLEPHGLILRLAPEPLKEISAATLAANGKFWRDYLAELRACAGFDQSSSLRSALVKCRTAQAGVFADRKMWAAAEAAFREAITIYPYSPEASYRLTNLLAEQGKYAEAREVMTEFLDPSRSYPFTKAANLRLARVYRAEGKNDTASALERGFSANDRQNPFAVLKDDRSRAEECRRALERAGK